MGLVEKDPIVRLLEELTKRKAAARASLAGGHALEALATLDQARKLLGGALASTIERVDGATVVTLLGKDKAAEYAALARLEVDVRHALGEVATAARAEARAVELERALAR